MTSIVNLFSNFNDLTKPKSVTDNVTDYKADVNGCNEPSFSLIQGKKFKKYQGKIADNLEKTIEKSDLVEGFGGLNELDLNKNGLTEQTNKLLNKNDFSSQQQTLSNLKDSHQKTLNEYQALVSKINGNATDYIDRVSPNNPYLNKNVCLSGGACGYVTNQGVFKWYPADNNYTYNNTAGKNGCPSTPYQQISGDGDVNAVGSTISSNPPLIVGTPMSAGQSCGNEGVNVFVNSVVKNPQSSYINCYENLPPSTQIMFVPKMTASNTTNGYISYASSVYQNNNSFTGPWNAFDQNVNTWWHSGVDSGNLYNANTGQYTGTQKTSYINSSGVQTSVSGEWLQLNLPGAGSSNATNFHLTRYEIQGRQGCCGNPNGRDPNTWYIVGYNNSNGLWYQVDYQSNIAFNWKMLSFSVSNPTPYSAYRIIIIVTGSNAGGAGDRSCVQIATWNLYTGSNPVNNPKSAMTNVGQMNFDQCQAYSLNSGNKYFALQSVNSSGVGNCMTSNDLAGSQINGLAVKYQTTPLWASNTTGNNPGSTASLTISGTLSVLNSSGAAIFATPNTTATPSSYIGCYADQSTRAMQLYNNGSQEYSNSQCQQIAQSQGSAYYGLQDSTSGQNAQCALSSNLGEAQKYGLANNCTQIADGSWSGGAWSNAVYSTSAPNNNYFLILQDDGNLCIYKGSPDDNQGAIWCSMTNGKQQQPNANFAASKGKFGKNWMPTGSTLAPGDFIGSTDGSTYLIMQADGNLVLYTSTSSSKCSSAGGKTVGAQDVNALYQIAAMGNKDSIGKLAFIDQNSQSHSYPNNNAVYSNSYARPIYGIDTPGNDIPGAAFGGATVESCQNACDSNEECAGFVTNKDGTLCWPKTNGMYPFGGPSSQNSDRNIYVRSKTPKTPPIGVSGTVVNVDTIMYDNYQDGGAISNSYGLANATSTQKEQLSQLQSKLNLLTSQINSYTNKFSSGTDSLNSQSKKNMEGLGDYLKDFEKTNNNIKNFNTNIENILHDSDITVLQKNYDYLFWTILATGTVLVTMNIVKKQ